MTSFLRAALAELLDEHPIRLFEDLLQPFNLLTDIDYPRFGHVDVRSHCSF